MLSKICMGRRMSHPVFIASSRESDYKLVMSVAHLRAMRPFTCTCFKDNCLHCIYSSLPRSCTLRIGDCPSIHCLFPIPFELGNHDRSGVDANVTISIVKDSSILPAPHCSSHGNEFLVDGRFVVRKNLRIKHYAMPLYSTARLLFWFSKRRAKLPEKVAVVHAD